MRLNKLLIRLVDILTQGTYRLTGGRVGHHQIWTILLLTTTGRKTGKKRTHSLVYLKDGDRLLIVASNNGEDRHPAWYLNLQANPQVEVQYGRVKGAFTARTAEADERHALWGKLTRYHPPYLQHQAHTTRELPIIILTPVR